MVSGELLLPDFHCRAVEADTGDVVLAAAVRTAAHLDVHLLCQRVDDVHGFDFRLDGGAEAHRAGDAEFAAIRPRAAHHVRDRVRSHVRQPELLELLEHFVEAFVSHPAEDDVLLHGGAGASPGVFAHDLRQPVKLLGLQVAAGDFHFDGAESLLLLRTHVRRHEQRELATVAVRLVIEGLLRRGVRLFRVKEEKTIRAEIAVRPIALQFLVHHALELFDAHAIDEELQSRLCPVLPQFVRLLEDADDGFRDLEVFVQGREFAQHQRVARHDAQASPNDDLEALHAISETGNEAQVVDAGDRLVLVV